MAHTPETTTQQLTDGPVRVTPRPARPHVQPSRGQVKDGQRVVPESRLIAGRFGRMFRNLPSFEPSNQLIDRCIRQMLERARDGEELDNARIPSGFTYFGQFIDHDLTFDPVSELQRQNDPDGLQNFRTPNFDLDSVYGLGRADQPYLYQRDDPAKLLIGKGEGEGEEDLPRNSDGVALVGDPRNDENIIVSQVQLAFLRLHNQLVDDIRSSLLPEGPGAGRPDLRPHLWIAAGAGDNAVFREAQRLTRWHYQWVVLKEFVPLVCGADVVERLLEETAVDRNGNALPPDASPEDAVATRRQVVGLEFYQPKEVPFIPIEWSVAAYRYGHSQIRSTYNLNPFLREVNADIEIFVQTPTEENQLRHLGGGRQLPAFWTLDWRFFFQQNLPDAGEREEPQPTRLIDTRLARGLQHLPGITEGSRFLAQRNLERGRSMGLPSGQAVARRMGVAPLTGEELRLGGAEAPLWFYVLREAEHRQGGQHLGTVGGRIVAEVLLGILAADPFSFLRTEPTWEPVLPASIAGEASRWGMADLLAYAVPEDGRRFPVPS